METRTITLTRLGSPARPLRTDCRPRGTSGSGTPHVARSEAAFDEALADRGFDRLLAVSDWSEKPNLHRMLMDLIEEYARHTGHADLIRESIDGLVGEDAPQ